MAPRLSERDEVVRDAVAHGRRNASGWVRVDCPFCDTRGKSPDTKRSFAFNTATNGFVCNRCRIKGRSGGAVSVGSTSVSKPQKIRADEFHPLWLSEVSTSQAAVPAMEFLIRRGFTLSDVRAADVRVSFTGRYAGRVVVPHKDFDGSWWGFTARCWVDRPAEGVPKVLYPSGMDRSRLYNEHVLQIPTMNPCLVVEGVLDAVWYLPDVVASLGKPTEEHMSKFVDARRPLVFCLDGDAWEDGRAWTQRLRIRGVSAGFVRLPPKQDPNSVEPGWLLRRVREVCADLNRTG